jgi:hypothetical protein
MGTVKEEGRRGKLGIFSPFHTKLETRKKCAFCGTIYVSIYVERDLQVQGDL